MTNLHDLRLAVSSLLVLSARKWRRTSDGVLTAYNVSEACATPLLITGRLGEGVRQARSPNTSASKGRRSCACSTSCARPASRAATRIRTTAARNDLADGRRPRGHREDGGRPAHAARAGARVSRAPISKRRCACSTHSMRPSRTRAARTPATGNTTS